MEIFASSASCWLRSILVDTTHFYESTLSRPHSGVIREKSHRMEERFVNAVHGKADAPGICTC